MSANDLTVVVDAMVAPYEAAMVKAERATLQYEGALKRTQLQLATLERQMATEAAAAAAKQDAALRKLGRTAGMTGLAFGVAFGVAVKAAADFEAKMAQVNSLLKPAERGSIPLLSDAAKQFANLGISASEAADAEIELVKAGISARDILGGALRGTLVLAAAGQTDVAQATEIAASAMTQFGLSGAQIPHVADLLAAGADKALGGVTDLGAGLKQAGTTANTFGFTIEDTVGVLAEFAQAGLIGEQGGTTLKQMFIKLASPSKEAAGLMDKYNISLYNANGSTKTAAELAGDLHDAFAKTTPEIKNAALATIFGSRAIQGANILYNDGAKVAAKWRNAVDDNGFAAQQAAGKMESLNGDLQKLGASFTNLLVDMGEAGQGPARELVKMLTGLVDAIDGLPGPVKSGALALTGFFAVLGLGAAALIGLGRAVTTTKENLTTLGAKLPEISKSALLIRGGAAIAAAGLFALSSQLGDTHQELKDFTSIAASAAAGFAVGGPWGAALGAGVGLLQAFGAAHQRTEQEIKDLQGTLDAQTGAVTRNTAAWVAQKIVSQDLADKISTLGLSTRDVVQAMLDQGNAADKLKAKLEGIIEADQHQQTIAHGSIKVDGDRAKAARDLLGAIGDTNDKLGEARSRLELTREAEKAATAATKEMGNSMAGASAKAQKLTDSILALNNAALKNRSTLRDFKAAIDDATKALKENGDTLNINTAKGRANQAAIDAVAAAAISHAQAMKEDGAGIRQQTAFLDSSRASLFNVARQFGMTKAQAHDYVNQVLQIPKKVNTDVQLNTDAAKVAAQNLATYISNLAPTMTVTERHVEQTLNRNGLRHASGGFISGAGTGTSDSIPAMLSNGEFVVNARATSRNLSLLHAINAQGFASGGHVGRAPDALTLRQLLRMLASSGHVETFGDAGRRHSDAVKQFRDVERAERDLKAARGQSKNAADRLDETEKRLEKARNAEKVDKKEVARLEELAKKQRYASKQADKDLTDAEANLSKQRDQATAAADKQREAEQRLTEQSQAWTQAVLGLGAAFGGAGTSNTAQGLLSKLTTSTSAGEQFEHALKVLGREHLDPAILRQIRDEGPSSDGLALAQSLAAAPMSLIRKINRQQSALESIAGTVGTFGTAAGRSHGHGHHRSHGGGKTVQVNLNGPIHTHDVHAAARAIHDREKRALAIASQA